MREATIATPLLIDFVAFLGRRGLAADAVCRAAKIDPRWLEEPNARVPASAMERLWAAGEQLTGDADLGLHSAASYNPGALGIVGYVILSCRTAGDALVRLARYAPLLNEGLQVRVDHADGLTRCRFGAADGVASFLQHAPRQAVETLAAGIVLTLARLATRPPVPIEVCFRHPSPASTAEHRHLLGPDVRFDQPENAVVYATSSLTAGMLSADPDLLDSFEADARRRLGQLQARGAVSGRIQTLLGARLRGEVPSLASLAAELAMSERSVQRSLSEEHTSYRELVDEVRRDLALAHLARHGSTAADVAFLLGFSEPSAFTRAFRRWTGVSPTQFKAA
ncbi:AraC family transcriptional regulator [Piscinibacter sakaiensis]|uniref:Transcriptional regulator, AraC family n=1 Tax=Piscinibacter sakaiensis TaxID=1547922 RepID=A0A0K8P0G1_PISS1|nr:AraC family transcriptional regulator [Piscinibacter sakaiensis]GAP36142.1 transcriptional regulator, AraC family [Piscinibacter sakaiensis]